MSTYRRRSDTWIVVIRQGNLFVVPPAKSPGERIDVLMQWAGAKIERIESVGHTSPADGWYDQPDDEWVAILQGSARLGFADGREIALGPGDWLLIPARTRHRVTFTSTTPPCLWLAVHAAGGPADKG